jgi:hypothetical protein
MVKGDRFNTIHLKFFAILAKKGIFVFVFIWLGPALGGAEIAK